MDVDVNRTALLGGEPEKRASGVDEGDKMEHNSQSRLQQTQFYYKGSCQHDENTNANVPSAYRLLLEGEWLVCASGVSQSVDLGQNNNPNTTPTKDYKNVRVVVYLRSVQRGCAEEGERGSTPTG